MKYVELIGNDWNGTSQGANRHKNGKHDKESSCDPTEKISLVLSNKENGSKYEKRINMNSTLKSLFNSYADEHGISLRSLRFSYNGSILFLSSVGQKTPEDLEMKHLDVILVVSSKNTNSRTRASNKQLVATQAKVSCQTEEASKKIVRCKVKQEKKQPIKQQPRFLSNNEMIEREKLVHSKLLSKVFEEMDPQLKTTRQRLNDLTLERQACKAKRPNNRKKHTEVTPNSAFHTSAGGMGGKAGKVSFVVNVGRVENLYKTSKKRHGCKSAKVQSMAKLDLHGCTKDEAIQRLEASLKEWVDTAMHGIYPWVIPALIVCGGGNQILSETVEAWIRETETVAKVPKGSMPH